MRNTGLLILGLLLSSSMAQGTILTFEFSGTVDRVVDPLNHLAGAVSVGDSLSGNYSFDSTTGDIYPGDPTRGEYATIPPFTFQVGPLMFQSTGPGYIMVLNDWSGSDYYSPIAHPFTSGNFDIFEPVITLSDDTGQAFLTDQLPLEPPDLSLFSHRSFQMQGRPTGTTATPFAVYGTITAIPEPSSLVLTTAAAVLLLRRRKSSRVLLVSL